MALNRLLSRHPDHMRKIITYDKDAEHVEHILVTTALQTVSQRGKGLSGTCQWSHQALLIEGRFCDNCPRTPQTDRSLPQGQTSKGLND
jgi:hypothetical protein